MSSSTCPLLLCPVGSCRGGCKVAAKLLIHKGVLRQSGVPSLDLVHLVTAQMSMCVCLRKHVHVGAPCGIAYTSCHLALF